MLSAKAPGGPDPCSSQVKDDVNVAARGLRVRTDLLGCLNQGLGNFAINTR
jgi:hypothetical protein